MTRTPFGIRPSTDTSAGPSALGCHALSAEQVLQSWDADVLTGLSGDEAGRRLDVHGPNRLPETDRRGPLARALTQFNNPLIMVLIVAGTVTALLEHYLDAAVMQDAANALIGNHDFTSFRAAACQAKSPVKTLDMLRVDRDGEEIAITVEARSFLHHQVRNIAGTLKLVGEGKWTRADVEAALAARDRSRAGPTAPADGLYLMRVTYDPPR